MRVLVSAGSISGVIFRDITVVGVAYPLQLQARYCPGGQGSCPTGHTAISLHDITFENIRGYGKGAVDGIVGSFICSKFAPCIAYHMGDLACLVLSVRLLCAGLTRLLPTFRCNAGEI